MADSNKIELGIKLEGDTLRFFEHLVASNLAQLKIDPNAEQPYAIIHKDAAYGEHQVVVYAQAFHAAEDNLSNVHQAFFANEDGIPG